VGKQAPGCKNAVRLATVSSQRNAIRVISRDLIPTSTPPRLPYDAALEEAFFRMNADYQKPLEKPGNQYD